MGNSCCNYALFIVLVLYSFLGAAEESSLPDKIIVATEASEDGADQATAVSPSLLNVVHGLNVDVEFFYCPWARCLAAMENGQVDLLDKLYYSQDRESYLHYVKPAYQTQTSTFRFYSHVSNPVKIDNFDDLRDKTIGVVRSAIYYPKFDQAKDVRKISHLHLKNLVGMVKAKRIDALIAAPEFNQQLIEQYADTDELIKQDYEEQYVQYMYIGISRKSPWLVHKEILSQRLAKTLDDEVLSAKAIAPPAPGTQPN